MRFPKSTIAVTAACFIAIGCTMPWLGEELMPKFKETDFLMHWVEKPGIGIDATHRALDQQLMATWEGPPELDAFHAFLAAAVARLMASSTNPSPV